MFFIPSKVVGFLAAPSNALATTGLAGLVALLAGFPSTGTWLMGASVIGVAVAGLSPLGNLLLIPLEERFARAADEPAPTGLVILGGSFDTVIAGSRRMVALTAAAERLTHVAELARRWPEARVVFTGGSNTLVYEGATEADLAARLLESFGVEPARISLEDKSRNTRENALFTRELIGSEDAGARWLLVTSAYHMPRAIGCFRGVDLDVEPWPVDYRTRGPQDVFRPFSSVGAGLRRVDIAVREWAGLVAYWMLGYVSDPLPRP